MKNKILKFIKSAFTKTLLSKTGNNVLSGPALLSGIGEGKSTQAKQIAINLLVARGRSLSDAELIVKAMEEWQLDYSLADTIDFEVVGHSVWINNEE